jgi:hypothetical protein
MQRKVNEMTATINDQITEVATQAAGMTKEQYDSMSEQDQGKYARSQETYLNAPTDMQGAIDRIMELEMRLEDLSCATEIVEITRQFELLASFRREADSALETKITIDRPVPTEKMKITVVTGEVSQETVDSIANNVKA